MTAAATWGALWLLAGTTVGASAAPAKAVNDAGGESHTRGYIATNPLAAFHGLTSGPGAYVYPFLTGGEFGLALSGGLALASHSTLEVRFSYGRPNAITSHAQYHAGYLFFVLDFLDITEKGLYAGAFIKLTDNHMRHSDVHYFSLIPYFAAGYWFEVGRYFCDFRLQQTVLAMTFASAPHTGIGILPLFSPLPGVAPVLPALVVNVGVFF